jgi:hypothetical protein
MHQLSTPTVVAFSSMFKMREITSKGGIRINLQQRKELASEVRKEYSGTFKTGTTTVSTLEEEEMEAENLDYEKRYRFRQQDPPLEPRPLASQANCKPESPFFLLASSLWSLMRRQMFRNRGCDSG